jgi:hypothetical protein
MKRVAVVTLTVAALLAVSALASAEQPMFRPLDGSTWDRAQVQEWLEQKDVKKGAIILGEETHTTSAEEKKALPRRRIGTHAE